MRLLPRGLISLPWTPAARRPRTAFIAYTVLMLALTIPFATKKSSEWDKVFVATSAHLLAGEDIYDQPHGYVYPPLQALLAVPMLPLPHLLSRLAWYLVNAVALWIALRSAWRLAFDEAEPLTVRHFVVGGLGLAVGTTYFFNSLMHHQSDILVAALLFRGCESITPRRNRKASLIAATLFGIAAAMKCTPLLFAPYLLIRGRVIAAVWLVAVAMGVSLLPDLIHSPHDSSTWLSKWWGMFIAPMAGAEHRPGVWASDIIFNQSLVGALNRWTITTWTWNADGAQFTVVEPLLSPMQLKGTLLGLAALIGGASFLAIRRCEDAKWQCCVVLCGMLLFSPMSSPAHFGVLLLPALLLARSALLERSRMAGAFLGVMLPAAFASNKDLLGAPLYSLGLWHGSVMAAALAALGGSWAAMLSRPRGCG